MSWQGNLELLLSSDRAFKPSLRLDECLREVDAWLLSGTSPAQWERNARSISEELEDTCAQVGGRLRRVVNPFMGAARREISTIARVSNPSQLARSVAREKLQRFSLELASDGAIRAALGDLLDAAEGQTTLEDAQQLERSLRACIAVRSPEFEPDLRPIKSALGGSITGPHSHRVDGFAHQYAAQSRAVIEKAVEGILAVPRKGHCVVWIEYEFALVYDAPLEMGDVTLYDSYMFIPQARKDDGIEFPHREELRQVLKTGVEWWPGDGATIQSDVHSDPNSYAVARVDLGVRAVRGASEAADIRMDLILALATANTGSTRWVPTGATVELVDGRVEGHSVGSARREPTVSRYGMGLTAKQLPRIPRDLSVAISTRPIPYEITEAVRLISESGFESGYENTFGTTRSRHARTAVGLRNHAVEHIAAWGELSVSELDCGLSRSWAYLDWRAELGNTIVYLFRRNWETAQVKTLLPKVYPYGFGTTKFERVHANAPEILAMCDVPMQKQRLKSLMSGLDSEAHFHRAERRFQQGIDLELKRLRRVRNALVHGNPVRTSTIDSVVSIAERRSSDALDLAIDAFSRDIPLSQRLREIEREAVDRDDRLLQGQTLLEIWAETDVARGPEQPDYSLY